MDSGQLTPADLSSVQADLTANRLALFATTLAITPKFITAYSGSMNDSIGAFAMWLAVGFGLLGFFFSPIAKAMGRWIESKSGGGAPRRVQELESRVAELEHLVQRTGEHGVGERLAELEERMDFTERLLAQGERKQLG